jgi:hypothetical protein
MAKDTIKLTGPDRNDRYKVLATKGTLMVRPGEVYTEQYVNTHLLDERTKRRIETTTIEPKWDRGERREFTGTLVK